MTDAAKAVAPATTKRQRLTTEQKIARMQTQLANLKSSHQKHSRNQRTRELVLIGTAVDKAIVDDPVLRGQIVALVKAHTTRDTDKAAIASWLSRISTSE